MMSPALAAIPLARNAVTLSFCHCSRSARTAIAILVSKRMVMSPSLTAVVRAASMAGPHFGVLNAGAADRPSRLIGDNEAMAGRADPSISDWARYWRADGVPVEAMHAHFTSHVYHRHSHESYSFGVTEAGAQAFTCRRGRHVSGAGMVMAFNPDDPHDGHAAGGGGFTYRMVHVWPEFFTSLIGTAASYPLFGAPVIDDPAVARSLRTLHLALTGPDRDTTALERYERLTETAGLLVRHATRIPAGTPRTPARRVPPQVRERIPEGYADADLTADRVAAVAGCSRYAAYRAFTQAYGLAPSDY